MQAKKNGDLQTDKNKTIFPNITWRWYKSLESDTYSQTFKQLHNDYHTLSSLPSCGHILHIFPLSVNTLTSDIFKCSEISTDFDSEISAIP